MRLNVSVAGSIHFDTVYALYDADNENEYSLFYFKLGFQFTDPDEEIPPKEGCQICFSIIKPLIDAVSEKE
jgi:hypothetical protein